MKKITKQGVLRAIKFTGISIAILGFEFLLLFTLVEFFSWNEVIAATCSLIIALFVNYVVSRKVVFTETKRTFFRGLAIFFGLAVVNITLITLSMFIAVEIVEYNYLVSRLIIGLFFGGITYLNNLYFNFKVNEKSK